MASTHLYELVGDTHVGGRPVPHVDPLVGQRFFTLDPPATPPPVGTILTGATSGARAMVRRVVAAGEWIVKILDLTPWQWVPNETVNLDNGDSCHVSPLNFQVSYGPGGAQFLPQHADRRWNSAVPSDMSDTPYWDRNAKLAQTIVVPVSSVSGVTIGWKLGDRFTTSGGGAFTLQFIELEGDNFILGMLRKSGSIAAGQTITNTTTTGTGTIGTVNPDPPVGCWVPFHSMPSLNGLATRYELEPRGNSTKDGAQVRIGPENRFLHAASDYHRLGLDINDFGVRLIQFCSLDANIPAEQFLGGVTVQCIVCSGTFPNTWVPGETVVAGGYQAKVHGWNETLKRLYVTAPNGVTLAAGSITGQTSGAVATATGPAFGWQPGSKYFNDWVANRVAATSATGALYQGQALKAEGIALFLWETELGTFAPGLAPWPTLELMQAEWLRMIAAFRGVAGDADLPIGVWSFNAQSHISSIAIGGFPFALVLMSLIESLPKLDPNIIVVRSNDQPLAHPVDDACVLTPDASAELGERVWRALAFKQLQVDTTELVEFPIGLVVGTSQAAGTINTGFMITTDRDPDLWASGTFGVGISTVDPNVLSWNPITEQWEPWDATLNSNGFWNTVPGSAGFEVPLVQRMKRRWSKVAGQTAKCGFIKLAANGSCVLAEVENATATWDPDLSSRQKVTANCTVTVIPPDGLVPVQRIRLTAAAGTFPATLFALNMSVTITGSAGVQGVNGNNTRVHEVNRITAIAADRSWIEVIGNGLAATESLTVEAGPPPIYPEAKRQITKALLACASLNLIPIPVWMVVDHGDNDVAKHSGFQAGLQRLVDALERVFGFRARGQTAIPKVICQLTTQTPFSPTDDAPVNAIRAAQVAVAANLENCVVADPSDLAMELNDNGTWPRTHRSQNGVHRTARANLQFGFRIDALLDSLATIPKHPNGSASADAGLGTGASLSMIEAGGEGLSVQGPGAEGDDGAAEGSGSASLTASPAQLADLSNAMFESPDVAAYTDPTGHQVTRRSVDDLLKLDRAARSAEARRNGIRRTYVDFR